MAESPHIYTFNPLHNSNNHTPCIQHLNFQQKKRKKIKGDVKFMEDIKTLAPATKLINNISVSTSDVQIDPSRTLWFRLFAPNITETNSGMKLPLIVYYHGGGFSEFGPDSKSYDDLCTNVAAKVPAVVASVNYRLTPDHKYPSQYEEAYDALKFIDAQNSAVLPAYTDLSRCFVSGDSAGANIIHHATVRAIKNSDQFNQMRIIGVLSLQPFFGGEERVQSELRSPKHPVFNVENSDMLWKVFLPEGANRDHPAVNVSGGGSNSEAAKELKSLEFPTSLVIMGENDLLLDWQKRYVEWLKNCGKEVETTMIPNVCHAFYLSPEFEESPEFDLLFKTLASFIKKQLHLN